MWALAPEVSRFATRDRKQPKPQHLPIPLKVAVSCKNVPLSPLRHRTNQESNRRARYSLSPAQIMHVRCFLIVSNVNSRLIKSPQIIPQLDKLLFLANAREQLLPDRSHHLHPALPNQLRKGSGQP